MKHLSSIFFKATYLTSLLLQHVNVTVGLSLNNPRSSSSSSPSSNPTSKFSSRRAALSKISTLSTSLIPLTINPAPSIAGTPLTADDADNLSARIERKFRKAPPKLLRQNLNLEFAVLLMRSSYNAVDELKFVPMDQFQKDFFLIRQAEYLPYVNELGPGLVKQGELTDPYYFDFISFAQYATIYHEIKTLDRNMILYEEQQPIIVNEGLDDERQEFISKVIRRDTSVSNSMLQLYHDEIVGRNILDKLIEKFGNTASAIPMIGVMEERGVDEASSGSSSTSSTNRQRPDTTQLLASIQQIVNLFIISGFAFNGNVVLKKGPKDTTTTTSAASGPASGCQFEITLTAPATLWSGQSLAAKKANPVNDFVLKTAKAFVSRAGYKISSTSLAYTSTQEISTLTII